MGIEPGSLKGGTYALTTALLCLNYPCEIQN